MYKILLALLASLMFVSVAIASDYEVNYWRLTNPPIKVQNDEKFIVPNTRALTHPLSVQVYQPSAERECLPLPPWVTVDPNNKEAGLYQGELVEMSLNLGKVGDGSCPTCQYHMQLKSDHSITWDCLGLTNSERVK